MTLRPRATCLLLLMQLVTPTDEPLGLYMSCRMTSRLHWTVSGRRPNGPRDPLLFLSVDAALRLMKPVAYESGELCRTLLMQEMPSTGPDDDLVIWTVGQGLLPLGSFGGHAGVDNQHRAFPSLEIALGHRASAKTVRAPHR
jgi:hypothetical protein